MADEEKKQTVTASNDNSIKGISILGKIVGLVLVIWLVSVSYYAFAFFVLGMLPSILSMVIDRGAGKFASKTVSACNFIAMMPYLFDIAMTYERDVAAKQFMRESHTWIVIYGFAAVGWMLIWILPNIMMLSFALRADVKTNRLKGEQAKLMDEWGEEVKTGKQREAR